MSHISPKFKKRDLIWKIEFLSLIYKIKECLFRYTTERIRTFWKRIKESSFCWKIEFSSQHIELNGREFSYKHLSRFNSSSSACQTRCISEHAFCWFKPTKSVSHS